MFVIISQIQTRKLRNKKKIESVTKVMSQEPGHYPLSYKSESSVLCKTSLLLISKFHTHKPQLQGYSIDELRNPDSSI